MAIGSSQWMYNSGDYEIEQSLRFNDDDSAYLGRTPASDGNRKTMTFSFWSKRGDFAEQRIFGASSDNYIAWSASDQIELNLRNGGSSSNAFVITTAKYRDFSAWYHVVVAIDTTQSTAANRVKIYVNGEQETLLGTATYPSQNNDINNFNRNTGQFIGKFLSGSPYDGYLAEVNFIDGQGLTPNSFGETGDYGEWKPKKYRGTYGTNGYYLPFKQDYAVEGFSTVTWKGNSASSAYIGGVGFQPDLTWIKVRSLAGSHHVVNSVTGASTRLQSNDARVEAFQAENGYVGSFNTDGFTVAQGSSTHSTYTGWYETNQSGQTYVAWNWDMGNSYGLPHTITASGATNHSTAQQKFGTSSILFDGTTDKLTAASHADFNLLEKDFTFDMWVNFDVISNFQIVDIKGYADGLSFRMQEPGGSGKIGCYIANNNHTWNWVPSTGTWYHLALVRYGDSLKCYVDGSALTATAGGHVGGQSIAQGALQIGQELTGGTAIDFDGYIDDWRFSNIARYTGNFTVPSTTNTNDSNTILLIQSDTSNGSTTFVDSSGATPNTDGDITSYVSANTTYGQSIVSYTANGSATDTVGHGLNSELDMVITKRRDGSRNWHVGHTGITTFNSASNSHHGYLSLNGTGASDPSNGGRANIPNATTFQGESTNGQAMIAYCFHDVAGYSKFSSYTGNGSTTGPVVTTGFSPAFVMIKRTDAGDQWIMLDNTRSPSGLAQKWLAAESSNAEASGTSNNVQFSSTGFQPVGVDAMVNASGGTYIYMAFADTREYAYWYDQSGNNNDWTSNNLTESDVMVDSPTNNFPTLNPLDDSNTTLSEGNLKTVNGASYKGARATMAFPSSGKWYAEYAEFSTRKSNVIGSFRVVGGGTNLDDNGGAAGFYWGSSGIQVASDGWFSGSPVDGIGSGDVLQMAYDSDTGKVWLGINNQWLRASSGTLYTDGNPAGGSNQTYTWGSSTEDTFFSIWNYSLTGVANFGQDSSFAGNKTAQGNQDGNDIGDFYYAPPTGFLALCTANLPEVDVIPSEHFNTVLYTGNGSPASHTLGFRPNLVWGKKRNAVQNNWLINDVGNINKWLSSDGTGAEGSEANGTTFNTNGFTTANNDLFINNGGNYVTWGWKGNGTGTAVSNTNGTITSSVSANVDAGFSIATFTLPTTAQTIGHGLSKPPELIINKGRATGSAWWTFVKPVGNTKALRLDSTTNAVTSQNFWNNTDPTSTVVTIGAGTGSNNDWLMYCFHSVDGYSKVGSYVGNGNHDGPFVYCGFKPKMVIFKNTTAADDWQIQDTTRSPFNGVNSRLMPNSNAAESTNSTWTSVDYLSNGFKQRYSDNNMNASGKTYIFIAFAETPFKHSNAR